jgi:hypothetical protein
LQQLTIVKTTGQTFIGAKTTASGRLVINSATADAHLQIVGANSPSIRIDNAGSGGTQRFAIGNATAANNFIQGSAAGEFCITTASSGALLFGMWQTTNATEVMRISTSSNLIIGSTSDTGQKVQITGNGAIITGGNEIITNNQTALELKTSTTGKQISLYLTNTNTTTGKTYEISSETDGTFRIRDTTQTAFLRNSTGQIAIGNVAPAGSASITLNSYTNSLGILKITGALGVIDGNGLELFFSSNTSYAYSYDRGSSTWRNFEIGALNILFKNNTNNTGQIFASTGNWVIQTGGTIIDAGFKFDINGTCRIQSKLSLLGGTTSNAQINLASSTAPTSPNNGDIWFDGTNLFMRIGGVTKTFTII